MRWSSEARYVTFIFYQKAGDKVVITGMPIVIPDVGQLFGVNAESRREIYGRGRDGFGSDGVTGLKALGIRDLTYRIAFLALFVKPQVERDTLSALHDLERDSAEHGGMPPFILSSRRS
jgi:DNA replication licensing factor MCM6